MRRLALLVPLALAGPVLLGTAASAATAPVPEALATHVRGESPPDITDEITDRVGALGGRTDDVRDALERLAEDTAYQLFVVYVSSFDDWEAADWADAAAIDSGLGRDDILLAVAVDDRAYWVSVDDGIPLTDAQLDDVLDDVEDELRASDWAGAAIAAADGYRAAATGGSGSSSGGGGFPWLPVGLTAAGGIGLVALLRRRRSSAPVRGADGRPLTGPAALPTAELTTVAGRGLVAVDDALKASEQELGFAQAQFGMEATAPFTEAVTTGKQKVAQAFELRRRVEEGGDLPEADRRTMLLEIVRLCEEVDASLDAQEEAFAQLRDLHARAPEVLAEVDRRAVEVQARVPVARASVEQLRARYAEAALTSVDRDLAEAAALLDQARENATAGQAAVETDRAEAVSRARLAEDAVARAGLLLDGVDRAGTDLVMLGSREQRRLFAEAYERGKP